MTHYGSRAGHNGEFHLTDLNIDVDTAIAQLRGVEQPDWLEEELGTASGALEEALKQLTAQKKNSKNPEVEQALREINEYLQTLRGVAALMAGNRMTIEGAVEGYWGERMRSIALLMQNGLDFEDAVKAADQMDAPNKRNPKDDTT